jgi:DegV family protein with EDD domain
VPEKQPVKVLVDSPADIPPAWVQRLDIGVIPAFVNFGAESFADDGLALTRADFYRRLAEAKTLPTTSAPPAATAEKIMTDYLEKAEHLIVFTVARQFSSLYNSIRLAAEHVDPVRITVVDSGNVSMAEGWQVMAAAEAAAKGEAKDAVLAAARAIRERVRLIAAIDTLEYLRRGGRVSWALANMGALLQIKPLIEVHEGDVETIGRVRTMSKATQSLIDLTRAAAPLVHLSIMHSHFPEGAARLQAALADVAPAETMIGDVTTAIGTHIGQGSLGVIFVRQN